MSLLGVKRAFKEFRKLAGGLEFLTQSCQSHIFLILGRKKTNADGSFSPSDSSEERVLTVFFRDILLASIERKN